MRFARKTDYKMSDTGNNWKNIVLIGSVFALIIVSIAGFFCFNRGKIQIAVISEKKKAKIEKEMTKAADFIDPQLTFNGVRLCYTQQDCTYYLPLSSENEDWEDGEIASANENVQIFFLEDFRKEDKGEYIKAGRTCPFLVVSEGKYQEGRLLFTTLPVMSFDQTQLNTQDNLPLFNMTLQKDAGSSKWSRQVLTTATIRGNTSKSYEKKSLRLKLKKQNEDGTFSKKNCDLLGIRSDDDWILNGLYADNSRIRDKLCMDIWKQTGAYDNPYGRNYGMDGEYVEVIINNGYAGLYLLTHPIDAKQLGTDSVSSQMSEERDVIERVYKKKYTAAWNHEDFMGALLDENMPNFRGGFYLKGDTILKNEEEWKPLYDLAVCYEAPDSEFAENIGRLADQNNLEDVWLFFQGIGGYDNENKNYYYVVKDKGGSPYGYFVPWDLNISFGAVYADNSFFEDETMDEVETLVRFEPAMRMWELDVNNFQKDIKDKWKKWRNSAFSDDNLSKEIESLQKEIVDSGALDREISRWPDGNASKDISLLKEYALKRMAFLDSVFE